MTPDQWLLQVVRGDVVAAGEVPRDVDLVIASAVHHSVIPLVADALVSQPDLADDPLVERIRALAVHHAAIDLEREGELRDVLHALAGAGVRPLVFKGAHLAYSVYARPDLRPRVDTDVLIDPSAETRTAAHDALVALGYDTKPHVGGDLVMTQRSYVKRRDGRLIHAVDVHWRLSNPLAFASVLAHDELLRDARPIRALGPAARGPSLMHALVIACVHRVAHHAGADCLIWLCDIDGISRQLGTAEWRAFEGLIAARGIDAVCRASLRRTVEAFDTPVPTALLDERPASASVELTAEFLVPQRGRGSAASALKDWRAVPSWRGRVQLAREHLLPSAAYMRDVYAPASRAPLAWLYTRRALGALFRR